MRRLWVEGLHTVRLGLVLIALCCSGLAHAAPPKPLKSHVGLAQIAPATPSIARKLLAQGRYTEAEAAFTALSSRGSHRALLGLARVQLETGRYTAAHESAARAASHDEHRVAALTLQAEALVATGKLDAAALLFAEAVRAPEALRARALYARLLIQRGQKEKAKPLLQELIAAYNAGALGTDRAASLSYVAMAARMLNSPHDANDAFYEASRVQSSRVELQLEWAELFLDKRDFKQAAECVEVALKYNPHSARAHVLLARLILAGSFDFERAEQHLALALGVSPGLPAAHITRAAMALRDMDIERADKEVDLALATNPVDLEALSVRAGVRFLADDKQGLAAAQAAVLALHPRYARMYSIIGEYAEWEHRYPELIDMAQRALALDPDDPAAHAMLAMNLLRSGREKEGKIALEEAWKRDHFNAHVHNLLNLYDKVIDREYEDVRAEPFTLRLHKQERPVLEPYVGPMLKDAYDVMKARYGLTPEGPLRVEMYADAEHFSVRTTGMPNVGVQGVCFGKVITAVSPAAGPFNWGQITWHELAHVFHLQLSKNRVPRWFTEGLAEHETVVARSEWRREDDAALWTAFQQDRVPRLPEMNRAFTQAKTPQALMTAYYLASLSVAYIVERFGWDAMRPMLLAWAAGKRTQQVFLDVLGVSIEDVDRDLRVHLKKKLARFDKAFDVDFSRYNDLDQLVAAVAKAPKSAQRHADIALGFVNAGSLEEAELAAERALMLDPKEARAHFVIARVALAESDVQRAERALRAILATGQDGYILRLLLAEAAMKQKRADRAILEAEAAIAIDPEQLEAYRILLRAAAEENATPMGPSRGLALRALKALAQLDQHDPMLQLALLIALRDAGDLPGLRAAAERALFVTPHSPDVHFALGQGLFATGEPKRALVELDRALALGHKRRDDIERLRAEIQRALSRKR
jgi:tetratricopeptide (TPR) repeat protein